MSDRNTPPRVQAWHFHLNPFRPKQCQGGPVYFGWWARVAGWAIHYIDPKDREHGSYKEWEMSALEVEIKRNEGLIQ